MTHQIDNCRSCHAPIIWARTNAGKAMPVDAEPSTSGTVELTGDDAAPIAKVWREADFEQYGTQGREFYLSHFATCPDSPIWRRR